MGMGKVLSGTVRRWARSWAAALSGVVLALVGGLPLSVADTLGTDTLRLSPAITLVEPSASLPPEVQSLETQTAPLAFDRSTTSVYTAFDASRVTTQLDSATEIRSLKIFGAAPYTLSVEASINGAYQPVAGLQSLDLSTRTETWNRFDATTPVTTAALRFNLTPVAGGAASGIKGIEIWGKGGRVNIQDGLALLTALRGTTPPSHGRLYAASLAQGVIGGATDDPADNTFKVKITLDPASVKRLYLAYDVLGVSHWVAASRRINGKDAQGGFLLPPATDWATQIEPVDPSWFVQGDNAIAFLAPAGSTSSYTVRNLYLVAELENGTNFIASSSANQPEDTNPTRAAFDGDLATGWLPYPGGSVQATTPTLTLAFDKPTQLDGVALYLVNNLKGSIAIEHQVNGAWAAAATVDTKNLATGWNTLKAASSGAVDGTRLVFSNGQGSSASVMELQPAGSGVGPAFAPRIAMSYPDAGQYYGRTAYLRGFVQPLDNGSGAASLTVGGKAVVTTDGAFGATVTKDDVGFAADSDSTPWSVEIKAVYPDGKTLVSNIALTNYQAPIESTPGNLLPAYNLAVARGQAKKISYDGATLDIAATSLAADTTLGITPLKDDDLARLDQGMTNVTKGPRHGYRFTPHPMKFKDKIKVTLPYNKALIPAGLTEQDIKTFYFDDASGSWKMLERAALDTQTQTVTSLTDHFTDMINATVTVPDHPQAVSFNPTQIKDIKAADPGAQVNLIEPPKANNTGDARLSYPIDVPPGRQGLQPQLAVQYNSSGSNGWMGLGWDLPLQAISIDTRWGVPRYDAAKETETYTLNGEQLTPVAHRGEPVDRTAEKVFHTRVEGQFRKIVRHGTAPDNYWWEVTDKNGVRYIYGGDAQANTVATDATLTDDAGHVFMWSLREMRDLNNNFMRYHYARVSDTGVSGGSVPGANLYLQSVTYTGNGVAEGQYQVSFVRDRDLGESRRLDVQIDARGGFKRVTADLLRRVDVAFGNQLIRRYEFRYNENPYGDNRPGTAFNKTLLTGVIQYAADGTTEFNRHTFAYNDEARNTDGSYRGFEGESGWAVGSDGVSAGLMGKGAASALGGSKGTSAGGHIYIGVGSGSTTSKNVSGGIKVGYSRSRSESLIAMADMNGDGLPDKVYRGGGGFSYRPNQSGPHGTATFGDPVPLPSLPAISREEVTSTTIGGELYFGVAVMLDTVRATTKSDTYFADVNGDGITDLVSGGQVLFGYRNAQGVPTFSANSADTPVAIGGGAVDTTDLIEDASAIEAERAQAFPLLDTVRRWTAPYDGVVSINAPVQLIRDTSVERQQYDGADGVRVAIQLEGAELWQARILADNYGTQTPAGVSAVPVKRGDRLYFRVQSVFDGAYDQVSWDPEITYVSVNATQTQARVRRRGLLGHGAQAIKDVNGLPVYRYKASKDFTLAGRSGTVTMPLTGTLHLADHFEKGATTDDVTLVITRNGADVYRRTFGYAETASLDLGQDVAVTQGDTFEWKVLTDSPINATHIKYVPSVYYTAAEGVDDVKDDQGNYVLQVYPPYGMSLYPADQLTAPQQSWVVPVTGTIIVQPAIAFDFSGGAVATNRVVFTVKKRNTLLAKRVIQIVNGVLPDPSTLAVTLAVTRDDELFFDFSTPDTDLAAKLTAQSAQVSYDGGNTFTPVPSAFHGAVAEGAFPQPYRGWAVVGYNGNNERATQPINQALLGIDQNYDPKQAMVYPYAPIPKTGQWGGQDENAWVAPGVMSSSRLGLDDIRMPHSEQYAGASTVPRISRSTNVSASIVVGASKGDSRSQLDFQDLNGDRFPDVLGNGGVQYSNMYGGLGSLRGGAGMGIPRSSQNEALSVGLSGGGNNKVSTANAKGDVTPSGQKPAITGTQGSDMPSLGFGGNLGTGTSETDYDLIDINGDGLPDKVFKGGTAALNLGYRFAQAESWGGGAVNSGKSEDAGVSMSYNSDYYSIAGGLNLNTGTSRSDESYVDVNGDGLPDKVTAGSPLMVRLNTGNGFTDSIAWPGSQGKVAVDKHISLGGGVYFTFGFTIFGVKIVFNPGVNFSTSMGRPEIAFRDVDGDGFADQLFSTKDSELQVALNPIGRTNLLKSVQRPLGARFDIEYTRDGNTYDLPQSRWLMNKVNVFDGSAGDGVDNQVTTVRYETPKYNRLERDFYGYAKVIEEQRNAASGDALYRSMVREYLNDSYYTKGLLKREQVFDADGRPFTESENTYLLRNVDAGTSPADAASTTATIFPQLSRTDRRFYEGQAAPGKTTYTTHEYDALGNVTRYVDTGDTGAQDDVEALIQYTAADTACQTSHVVGKASRIDVLGASQLQRQRTALVDCATGNITQVSQFLENGQAAVTGLAYYPNGNLQTVTGPANKNGQRYSLSYEYDPAVATHVTRIADSFGLSSSATHNYLFGKVETTTDTNNQQTKYAYDSVGRVSTIVGPYEIAAGQTTIGFEYHPEGTVPYAVTRHIDKDANGNLMPSGTIDTLVFTDGLKRVLQTKKDAAVFTSSGAAPASSMVVSGRVLFDHMGRAVSQYYPVTEPKGTNTTFNPSFDVITPTTMAYDVLDRNLKTTIPDGTSTSIDYGFGPDRAGVTQFETTVTDANGKVKKTYRDVRELITAVREFNQGSTLWTSYVYDPLKQIVKVVDDRSNVTTVAYDNLGRRTAIKNPDTGKTQTRYDLASNVIARITANLRSVGQQVSYDYDFNRLKSITYPQFAGNNIAYTYGAPGAANYTAGRITKVTSQGGTEERTYGPLGEMASQTWTIASDTQGNSANSPEVYTTRYQYDTWNRIQRLTYPDGEVLTYAYDAGGLVTSAKGIKNNFNYDYLKRLDYDKFEQRAYLEAGNQVRTAYSYDPRNRRLCGLVSGKGTPTEGCRTVSATPPSDPNAIQALAYQYDNVGNILGLQNQIAVPPPSQYGGPVTQTFVYDDLYRLTSAEGRYDFNPDKRRTYSLAMAYDSIHNILSKQQTDIVTQPSGTPITQKKTSYNWLYAYSQKPHAPTHIGNRTFSYDANGNQLGWDNDDNGTRRTIVWDEENRIQSLFDNGHEKTYKYDDQGQRIIKRGPQGETVYINQYITMRNREIGTKHVYVGTTKLVSKMMKQDKPGANPNGNTPVEKDLYFYHPDHLGSSSYITDTQGKLYEHLEYFPFGEAWVEESTNTQRTPYLFTSKELDEETGLYYFGARFYDPRTSVWQSADPVLNKYLPNTPTKPEDIVKLLSPTVQQSLAQFNLPGMGGIYKPQNLNLYQYSFNNPTIYTDPDGKLAFYWHFIISFSESSKAGLGFWKSLAVAWNAMMYDFRSGSQGTDPAAANSHAMQALDPETGKPQPPEAAAVGTESFIAGRLAEGTLQGLGEATHPEADKPAAGHKGRVWEGFSKLGILGTLKHIAADMFPSKEVRQEAHKNVGKTIEKWKEMHQPAEGDK